MEILTLFSVYLLGVVASFIGTNVGGSALTIIPVFILLGLPPQMAIATSKAASLGTMISGLYKFNIGKKIDFRVGWISAIFALVGTLVGANILVLIPNDVLEKMVGVLLLVLLILVFMRHHGVWDLYELYDIRKDPDQMNNLLGHMRQTSESGDVLRLIKDPGLKELVQNLQERLFRVMKETGGRIDPTWEG